MSKDRMYDKDDKVSKEISSSKMKISRIKALMKAKKGK